MSGKLVADMTPEELERVRAQRRTAQARYRTTPEGKAAARRYWQTENGRANSQRNRTRNRANWAERLAESQRERNQRQPERRLARYAVNYAIRSGRLVRPTACEACGSTGRLHGHHHRGYVGDAQLDVRWLCTVCHRAAHP